MDQNNSNQANGQNPSAADLSALINQLASQTNDVNAQAAPVAAPPTTAPTPTQPEPVVAAQVVQPSPAQPEPVAPVMEEKTVATAQHAPITVFTIPNCPFCKAEKDYLTKAGISFTEKNVEQDENNLKEMLELSDNFAGVPVTLVENQKGEKSVIRGFTEKDFVEELTRLGLAGKGEIIKEAMPTAAPAPVAEPAPVIEPAPVQPVQPTPAVEAPQATSAAPTANSIPDLN